jgi:hypothetical protein
MSNIKKVLVDLTNILGSTAGQLWIIYLLTCCFFLFTMLWPNHFLRIKEPFKIINKSVTAQSVVWYEVDYCKDVPLSGVVMVQLMNSHPIPIKTMASNIPAGCGVKQGSADLSGLRPCVPPGKYYLRWTAVYHPWPWITKEYVFNSEWFEVVK